MDSAFRLRLMILAADLCYVLRRAVCDVVFKALISKISNKFRTLFWLFKTTQNWPSALAVYMGIKQRAEIRLRRVNKSLYFDRKGWGTYFFSGEGPPEGKRRVGSGASQRPLCP